MEFYTTPSSNANAVDLGVSQAKNELPVPV
jgi:hypothetical protein